MIVPKILKFLKNGACLRDSTLSTALTMIVFYLIAAIAAGSEFVSTLSGSMSPYLFAVMSAMNFAVGVAIVYSWRSYDLGGLDSSIPRYCYKKLFLMPSQL